MARKWSSESSSVDLDKESMPPLLERTAWELSPRHERQSRRWTAALGILFALNIAWTVVMISSSFIPQRMPLNDDLRKVSVASPLFELINLGPAPKAMSGSIHDDGSIFRQPPSAEVDKAWARVASEGYDLINVTSADIAASGKDPSTRARWAPDVDSYPAQVEFVHKIHCLNEIRKEIWGEHYFGQFSIHADDADTEVHGKVDSGDPSIVDIPGARKIHRQHAMHCLHMLLQDLTCNVDVGIITHNWIAVPGKPVDPAVPLADFSTNKQCRDFEAALSFLRENAVEDGTEKYKRLRGHGVDVLDTNDSYWAMGGRR